MHHAFCTFLCHHCTTTTWIDHISRFIDNVNIRWQISLSLPKLDFLLKNSTPGKFAYIGQGKRVGIIAPTFQKTRSHFFKRRFRCCRRRGKLPDKERGPGISQLLWVYPLATFIWNKRKIKPRAIPSCCFPPTSFIYPATWNLGSESPVGSYLKSRTSSCSQLVVRNTLCYGPVLVLTIQKDVPPNPHF